MAFDIQTRGIEKSFAAVKALDGLSLSVAQGEMVGFIGPDGAGKTTFLRILCGLLIAHAGECQVGGYDPRRQTRSVREFVGYMPQRFSLYPDLTVTENLSFFADLFRVPAQERQRRLARLLEFSRLGPFAKRRAAALSGGMKQKLALSCTLIHTPKILLLDEPTTGVDPVSRREFWNILKDLRSEGVTILVTTPYMDEAARCDRVAFVHKGKILADTRPERIAALYKENLLEVKCDRGVQAARLLVESGRFSSVQVFGDRLHVSAAATMQEQEMWIREKLGPAHITIQSVKSVPASIEDVFVELLK